MLQGVTGATGTITVNEGNTGVTGFNTAFNTELRIGDILNTTVGPIGIINYIIDNTNLYVTTDVTDTYVDQPFLTNEYNILQLDGDFLPPISDKFSLGNENKYWKNLHIGPGTITLISTNGNKGNIGFNQNGIIYFDKGSAGPYTIIGPNLNTTGQVGGWKLSTTGTPGGTGENQYDLIAQEVSILPGGLTGSTEIFSLIRHGYTGYTGPTGPTGQNGIQSGHFAITSLTGSVTFNTQYTTVPVVVMTIESNTDANLSNHCMVTSTSVSGFNWKTKEINGQLNWISNGNY